MKAQYAASPAWLKTLMNAWADGLNFYLAKHPEVKPRVITHFEPWMALTFSEGSIGGDIETRESRPARRRSTASDAESQRRASRESDDATIRRADAARTASPSRRRTRRTTTRCC